MTGLSNATLWQRISDYQLDKPGVEFSFTQRLARENGWTPEFAGQVVEEYKKFIYLVCVSEEKLTPSEEVDRAWHLHLVYTRDYWDGFCRGVLGRDIHHEPTEGGEAAAAGFRASYQRTLERYRDEFNGAPPAGIWPTEDQRFATDMHRMVDTSRTLLVSKRRALATAFSGAAAMAAYLSFSYFSVDLGFFLAFVSFAALMSAFGSESQSVGVSVDASGCSGCGGD